MDRIELLSSLLKNSKKVADCGCDHGYVLIDALKKYDVEEAIFIDVNKEPLALANKNYINSKLEKKASFILSDGFKDCNLKFDTAVIAGMGGILIKNILEESYLKIKDKKLILQPNSDRYLVRKYLNENSFKIVEEYALYDSNKYYEIIVAIPGKEDLNELDLNYGPILRKNKNEAFLNYYNNLLEQLNDYIPSIKDNQKKEEKLEEFRNLIKITTKGIYDKKYINNTKNYYETYFIDDKRRPTIIVSPGGGYAYCSPREKGPIVYKFNELGYHVVVVDYLVTKEAYPMPGMYFASVINEIKNDPKISILIGLGFSAGGHNILEVNVHNDLYNVSKLPLLMLAYPVITSDERYYHNGSFVNLLQNKDSKELREKLSLEKEIQNNSINDLFLWGTITDESVNYMNSILLLESCKKSNINVEYHLYPMGSHGLSSADFRSAEGNINKINPYIADWIMLAHKWISKKIEELNHNSSK